MVSLVNLDCLDFFLQAGALALSADESGGAHMTRLFRVVQAPTEARNVPYEEHGHLCTRNKQRNRRKQMEIAYKDI
jgi:hypothetical protein